MTHVVLQHEDKEQHTHTHAHTKEVNWMMQAGKIPHGKNLSKINRK